MSEITPAPAIQEPPPAAPAPVQAPSQTLPGVAATLAVLPEKALLDEAALAKALGVCKRTIRSMVGRYELPPPIPFAGKSQWFAGKVLAWIETQTDRAAKEAERAAEKFRQLP